MVRYNPSCETGLNDLQINERIQNNLVNYNDQPPTKTIGQIFKSNFFTYFNFINLVLGGAIIAAGIFGGELWESIKNCTFMGVIIFNSLISIAQEIISKKTIDKLSILTASKLTAIRNGKEVELGIEEIVLDDILKLKLGDQVLTDSIILKGTVEANESFLTGEVDPIKKVEGDLILSGSFIVSGTCYARVEHIGKDNYISKISSEAKYDKKVNSIIMNSFEKILKVLSVLIIPIGILLFINQLLVTGSDVTASIFGTVAALIGMIPEGLLLLTSSVMAVSVIRLSKFKVLVQKLYCIETLARVDVICLDKTGTITMGEMELREVVPYNGINQEILDEIVNNMCNSFKISNATLDALKQRYNKNTNVKVKNILEFSSSRKYSAVTFNEDDTYYMGAIEFLLGNDSKNYSSIIEQYSDYRLLVIASKKGQIEEVPTNLSVIGFVIIQDKIRKEAPDTLKYFKDQGVKVKIISGDNPNSVAKIARRAGLENTEFISATEINNNNINEYAEKYNVFGRVTPEQKKHLIETLQQNGHTVAMTGDGVNDVLALKTADCSIAMASGSDAAKNVSQLVLLDSNFASMPKVVAEGRRTINNVERSASLLLIKTIFTAILVVICIFMQSEYFYMPIHLSLITTCTISIPSFILALEPNNDIVKGNFMLKVIGKSFPAALTVVFNVVMIVLYKRYFNISEDITSTLIVMMTGTSGFIFLNGLCKPYNKLRIALMGILITLFTYVIIFHYSFFDLNEINAGTMMLYIVFAFASCEMFENLNKITNFVIDKIENLQLKKKSI